MDSNQSSNTNDYEFDMQNLLPDQEESSEYTVLTEMVDENCCSHIIIKQTYPFIHRSEIII